MSYMGKDYSSIIVAGHQNVMLKVDVEKGQVVEEVNNQSDRTMNHWLKDLDSYRASVYYDEVQSLYLCSYKYGFCQHP